MSLNRREAIGEFITRLTNSTPFSFYNFTEEDIQIMIRNGVKFSVFDKPSVNDFVNEGFKEYINGEVGVIDNDTFRLKSNLLDRYIYSFFRTLKESKRKKILFGPSNLNEANKMLDINLHMITPNNSHSVMNHPQVIRDYVEDNINDDDVVLLASGFNSHIISDIIKDVNTKVTCINMGSMLNDIFVGRRDYEIAHKDNLKEFFKNLL